MRFGGCPMPKGKTVFYRRLSGLIPLLLLLLCWIYFSCRVHNDLLLPGPSRVWRAGLALWHDGRLWTDLFVSMGRVGLGFLMAVTVGLPLGLLAGRSPGFAAVSRDLLNFLRQIPPVALIPLFILWLGLGEAPKVLVIFYASFFPILLSSESGARQVDLHLIEVGRLYRLRGFAMLRTIVLPSALPSVITGMRLGLGYGWRSLVIAEMLAASRGLGALIVEARGYGRTDQILVGILMIGLAGTLLDLGIKALERFTPWVERGEKTS